MSELAPFVSQKGNCILITIRLTPNTRKTALTGLSYGEGQHPMLKAGVTAAPEDGKANAALIKLLAKTWRLRLSDIRIRSGHKARL